MPVDNRTNGTKRNNLRYSDKERRTTLLDVAEQLACQ
jgi:hypothetical protein